MQIFEKYLIAARRANNPICRYGRETEYKTYIGENFTERQYMDKVAQQKIDSSSGEGIYMLLLHYGTESLMVITSAVKDRKGRGGGRNWKQHGDDAAIST